jgi:hypothetical protein
MSGTDVLEAVATYLTAGVGTIPHLSQVLIDPPKFLNRSEFYDGGVPANASIGAIIWLWLGPQSARRIDLQGRTAGGKMYTYDLHLQCVLLSTAALSQDAGAANREFVDGLTSWIDADKNAGNSGVIFQWGEGKFPGGEDMNFESTWPIEVKANSTTHVYTKGTVVVCEYHGAGV